MLSPVGHYRRKQTPTPPLHRQRLRQVGFYPPLPLALGAPRVGGVCGPRVFLPETGGLGRLEGWGRAGPGFPAVVRPDGRLWCCPLLPAVGGVRLGRVGLLTEVWMSPRVRVGVVATVVVAAVAAAGVLLLPGRR